MHCRFPASSNVLKQREKCVKSATTLVESGTSVVIGKVHSAEPQPPKKALCIQELV